MASSEHCASLDSLIPRFKPLTSDVGSLHDPAIAATSSAAPQVSGKPESRHDIGGFLRRITAPLKLSLVLENKGNVARDHLASERTYLAYVRTSLACSSAGVAVVQLLKLNMSPNTTSQHIRVNLSTFARPLGATIILFGLVILVFGLFRYFTTQSALVRGYFPVARHSISMIAFILGSLVCVVFAIVAAGTHI